jgi:lipid-A-disaccharide synthase
MLNSTDQNVKKQFLSVSDVALVKSGTSAIEMAFYNIPTVVAYKMNAITYMYIKRKLNVKYASLINILLDREVFKEFIQGECRPELIIKELNRLLNNGNGGIKKDCELFLKILGKGAEPSMQAAKAVSNLLK